MLQNEPNLPFRRQIFSVFSSSSNTQSSQNKRTQDDTISNARVSHDGPVNRARTSQDGSSVKLGASNYQAPYLEDLLPASYSHGGDLEVPLPTIGYFQHEFNLNRLNKIYRHLWLAGRPVPPRPLHFQLEVSREIVISEQMDIHLLWDVNKIYLKPVPRYLLDYNFWKDYLACEQGCECSRQLRNTAPQKGQPEEAKMQQSATLRCARRRVYGVALGFLLSYAALIRYESDLHIAHERHLLPEFVDWTSWRTFVGELLMLDAKTRNDVDKRFRYGELRLSRLNKIYTVRLLVPRGYRLDLATYGDYFHQNLAPILSFIAYVAIVLTAMQVGLATERLAGNKAFQDVSFGFTVFSIIGPLALVAVVGFIFLVAFVYNFILAVKLKKERLATYVDKGNDV